MKRLLLMVLFAATTLPITEAFGSRGNETADAEGPFHGRMEANGDYNPSVVNGISNQLCDLQLKKMVQANEIRRREADASGLLNTGL